VGRGKFLIINTTPFKVGITFPKVSANFSKVSIGFLKVSNEPCNLFLVSIIWFNCASKLSKVVNNSCLCDSGISGTCCKISGVNKFGDKDALPFNTSLVLKGNGTGTFYSTFSATTSIT